MRLTSCLQLAIIYFGSRITIFVFAIKIISTSNTFKIITRYQSLSSIVQNLLIISSNLVLSIAKSIKAIFFFSTSLKYYRLLIINFELIDIIGFAYSIHNQDVDKIYNTKDNLFLFLLILHQTTDLLQLGRVFRTSNLLDIFLVQQVFYLLYSV